MMDRMGKLFLGRCLLCERYGILKTLRHSFMTHPKEELCIWFTPLICLKGCSAWQRSYSYTYAFPWAYCIVQQLYDTTGRLFFPCTPVFEFSVSFFTSIFVNFRISENEIRESDTDLRKCMWHFVSRENTTYKAGILPLNF